MGITKLRHVYIHRWILWSRVIIDDFDIISVALGPSEADAPLIINSNAHLPLPDPLSESQADYRVDCEGLQPWSRHLVDGVCARPDPECRRETCGLTALARFVRSVIDHPNSMIRDTYQVFHSFIHSFLLHLMPVLNGNLPADLFFSAA